MVASHYAPRIHSLNRLGFWGCAFALVLVGQANASTPATDNSIDYDREIRPVLSKNCFACHGPDPGNRKEDLRLDTRAGATENRAGVVAISPGSREQSELWLRINDPKHPMPPIDSGHSLTPDEKQLLGRWIAAGAKYAPHWSLVPVERPTPPEAWTARGLSPIDAFVRAGLEARGLTPSRQANRSTLGRRLALGLTGLPPEPEHLRAFVEDHSPEAYATYVNDLLALPHYGEHWAAMWLDLARYADSKGYGSDPLRTIWRWRDWVIEAFDQNMPFDRFTELQMAGDLVADATWRTKLATAFHRNSMVNTEGGTDDEEYRVAAVKDRANTTAQVWLGLTLGCAQCHSHKFDPISQSEYYSFFALFNQTADRDANDDAPRLLTPTKDEEETLSALETQLQSIEARIATVATPSPQVFDSWIERQLSWKEPARRPDTVPTGSGASLTYTARERYEASDLDGPARDSYSLVVEPKERPTALLLRAYGAEGLPGGGPGLSPGNGNFVLSELRAFARPLVTELISGRFVRVQHRGPGRILSLAEVEVLDAGQNIALGGLASQSSLDYGGLASFALDGDTVGSFEHGSVTHTQSELDPWWEVDLGAVHTIDSIALWNRSDGDLGSRLNGAMVQILDGKHRLVWESLIDSSSFAAPSAPARYVPIEGERLKVIPLSASFQQSGWPLENALDGDPSTGWAIGPRTGESHEAVFGFDHTPSWPFEIELALDQDFGGRHLIGSFDIEFSSASTGPRALPQTIRKLLLQAPSEWSAEERKQLETYAQRETPEFNSLLEGKERVQAQLDQQGGTETPVLVALGPGERRETHILLKGNFLSPGALVKPGVPACIEGTSAVTNRLELAHWLTSRENPLTARVQVNRLWARLFGQGLVTTEEDFGSQGSQPTYPKLLDWLAAEFMDSGWDQEHLLRTIVSSATYRQDSFITAARLELDPNNQWLARGPRFRLSAEQIRDQALSVSGLLSPKKFGPSVFPPQPAGLWQAAFNGADRTWETSTGEDRYRRALYVFLRRSSPYPSLQVFDAPTRESCTSRRIRTNTPLQAFVTLNDPALVECAQALARRIVREAGGDDAARAEFGLQLALQRPVEEQEVEALTELVGGERLHFNQHLEDATRLACDPLGPLIRGEDPIEFAAWTVAANVILNLDEFLTLE